MHLSMRCVYTVQLMWSFMQVVVRLQAVLFVLQTPFELQGDR